MGSRNRGWRDEAGATAVEYGIMVALIALVIFAAVFAIGRSLQLRYAAADACIEEPSTCP
jgi:pilus assembly protein Flp/PilA